jgi:hypothetical protein
LMCIAGRWGSWRVGERYLRKRTTCHSVPLGLMRHLCNVSTRWKMPWHFAEGELGHAG